MKKTAILIICMMSVICSSAQDFDEQQEYDTVIYFPSTILECPMFFDSIARSQYYDNRDDSTFWPSYHNFMRLLDLRAMCHMDTIPIVYHSAKVVGHQSLPGIRSFAQPYYLPDLDTNAIIIGVAAKIYGDRPPMSSLPYFILYDGNGNMLDNAPILYMTYYYHSQTASPLKYYFFRNGHSLNQFSLAYDKNNTTYEGGWANKPYQFDHTMSFTGGDPSQKRGTCKYEDKGCYEYLPPLYKMYDSVNWVSFETDSVYRFYYKKQIGFYPIILVPKNNSSLAKVDISQHCNIIPNPASNFCKVISRYKIDYLEVFDINGRKMFEGEVNAYERYMDLSAYPTGTYIFKINTQAGIANKKLIVK